MFAGIFDTLRGEELIPIVAILVGGTIFVIAIIAQAWRRTQQTQIMADLKRDLIAQGRSTEEIERIVSAGLGDQKKC